MKKYLFLLLTLLCLMFTGCGQKPVEGLPMPQGLDGLAVEESTYYMGQYPNAEAGYQLLLRIPKGERMPIPVCSQPDCQHKDSGCSAYYKIFCLEEACSLAPSVGYFRDRLYTVSLSEGRKAEIYSVSPETGERRLELMVDPQELYDTALSGLSITALFHENNLILLYAGPVQRLLAVDLTTMKQKELFRAHFDDHVGDRYAAVLGQPMAIGSKLYLLEDRYQRDSNQWEHQFLQLDLLTEDAVTLLRDNDLYTWRIEGDRVFFSDQNEKLFKEYDLTAGTVTVPSREEIIGEAFYTDDLIVTVSASYDSGEAFFGFYSRDYTKLADLKYDGELVPILITKDAVYFHSDTQLFYLQRQKIGNHIHLTKQDLDTIG